MSLRTIALCALTPLALTACGTANDTFGGIDTPDTPQTMVPAPQADVTPISERICLPSNINAYRTAEAKLNALAAQDALVAERLSLCDENSCAPCDETTNPALVALREADAWGSKEFLAISDMANFLHSDETLPEASGLEVYFNHALAYPYQPLVMTVPADAEGESTLTLTRGVAKSCLGEDCAEVQLSMQSLSDTCDSFETIDVTIGDNTLRGETSDALIDLSLPLAGTLPEFEDAEALEAWMRTTDIMSFSVNDLSVELTYNDDGSACASLHGDMPASYFSILTDDEGAALSSYADINGNIPTTLSVELTPATLTNGSK